MLGAALLVALGACTRARHPVVDIEVRGATVRDNALLGLGPDEVEGHLREVLEGHGRFQLVEKKEGGLPGDGRHAALVLEVPYTRESVKDGREGLWAEVGVSLALRRKVDALVHRYDVVGMGEVQVKGEGAKARQRAMRDALTKALESAAEAAHLQLRALQRTDAQLLAELRGDGPGREYALTVLTERQNPAVVEVLIARVRDDEDPQRVRAAIGALAEMREERAVRPLIEATRGRESVFIREVVFALAQIGGEEAMAYVFTVAQGHDDPAVRDAAQRALGELEERTRRSAGVSNRGSGE